MEATHYSQEDLFIESSVENDVGTAATETAVASNSAYAWASEAEIVSQPGAALGAMDLSVQRADVLRDFLKFEQSGGLPLRDSDLLPPGQ